MIIRLLKRKASSLLAVLVFTSQAVAFAQPDRILNESFQSNPVSRGWEIFGDATLFNWDATEQNLRVTWDSSRTNSYFAIPLGLTLTRKDAFSISLDLTLLDLAVGSTAGKPGALQLAFGFQNQADAQKTNFIRGTSTDSPNLVEFNYFPDTGFGATVWPVALSTNSGINYNGPQDYSLFELPLGVPVQITLEYQSTNETIQLSVRTNGVLVGPIASARLSTNTSAFSQPFTDFAVNAFAIPSYSDHGQQGEFAGSLLAHGVVDNVRITVPPPAIQDLEVQRGANGLQVTFISARGWRYTAEATTDFASWQAIADSVNGGGERISITDPGAITVNRRFYRVSAVRQSVN